MPNLEQFESVFKAATRKSFELEPPNIKKVLVVTDLDHEAAQAMTTTVRQFLRALGDEVKFEAIDASQSQSVEQLLAIEDEGRADLVVTYRNLHSSAWQWPYSLGRHLDVLTQATNLPILVWPHPQDSQRPKRQGLNTDRVMAATDSLVGDAHLINYAIAMTQAGGLLYLTHVEPKRTLQRFLDAMEKIPNLDSEVAKTQLEQRLIEDNQQYIESCTQAISDAHLDIKTQDLIQTGHQVSIYKNLISKYEIDLLVLNTKDPEQLAMRGPSYALAVELRQIPLLLL